MKKILFVLSFFAAPGFSKLQAQIVNNDFQYWALDTFYLPADTIGTLPADTIVYNNPVSWTSTNVITGLDAFGGRSLVVQSNDAYSGSQYAIEMFTDTVDVPPGLIHNYPITSLTIPGFALNGTFQLGTNTFTDSTVITPGNVAGAGQPFNQRLATINGYYQYKPVFDPNISSNDTCVIWAVLRNGSTIVASAMFKSTDSTAGYLPFSVPFQYVSCDMPDTLVILLSSSATDISTFIYGLIPGSKLWVDSLYYTLLPDNFTFPPFVAGYVFTVYENQTDTFDVLAGDTDCSSLPLTVSLVTQPHHGTASVSDNEIVYTPNTGFLGLDSVYYKATNANGDTADALVQIFVNSTSGINSLNTPAANIFPNPAASELTVQFENSGGAQAMIYDMAGKLVFTNALNKNTNQLNIASLANGLYCLQIMNGQHEIIARSKFAVAR